MYKGLVASGAMLALFGIFMFGIDFFVPLGISIFGLVFLIAGLAMFVAGFFRSDPAPIEAEPGKKFCWYCFSQIPKTAPHCPLCSLPQYDVRD